MTGKRQGEAIKVKTKGVRNGMLVFETPETTVYISPGFEESHVALVCSQTME